MRRSLNEIEQLIKEGLKQDGYPDADSYSRREIIRILEKCFQEIARSCPYYSESKSLAYQGAKAQLLEFFHITEAEFDYYCQ